jgi:hypothetical protein
VPSPSATQRRRSAHEAEELVVASRRSTDRFSARG